MKNNRGFAIVCASLGVLLVSCVTPATDDEIESMCNNLVQLRGEIPNPNLETIVSNITVRFDQEKKRLEESNKRRQEALKAEIRDKLNAAKKEKEKTEIKREYEAKLHEMASKHQPKVAAMNDRKSGAVAGAKKKAEVARSEWDYAVNECVAQAKKEGVGQEVARCRIQAKTTDKYWNGCR